MNKKVLWFYITVDHVHLMTIINCIYKLVNDKFNLFRLKIKILHLYHQDFLLRVQEDFVQHIQRLSTFFLFYEKLLLTLQYFFILTYEGF